MGPALMQEELGYDEWGGTASRTIEQRSTTCPCLYGFKGPA